MNFPNPPDSTLTLKALLNKGFQEKTEKKRKILDEFKLATINKNNPDSWYIYFSILMPNTFKYKPFKVRLGINYIKDLRERNQKAKAIKGAINELLQGGWSPLTGIQLTPKKTNNIIEAMEFVLEVKAKTVDPKTLVSYMAAKNKFVEWLKKKSFEFMQPQYVTHKFMLGYFDDLKLKTPEGVSINNDIRFIKAIFGEIKEREIIEINPCEKIKLPKVAKGKTNIPMTPAEFSKVSKYLTKCKQYPKLHIHAGFIYNCCLRPKEIRLLKISDVRFDLDSIDVRVAVSKNKQKQPIKAPKIFLNQLEYLKKFPEDYYVFGNNFEPSAKIMATNNSNNVWRELIKKKLKVDKDEYSLKHSRAIHMYLDGAKMHEIQTYLRHANPSETENYMRSMIGFISDETLDKTRVF